METNPPVRERALPAKIFLSPEEPRLRAGWRLLAQTILFFIFILIFGIPFGILALFLRTDQGLLVILQFVELLATTGSIFLVRIFLDRRSISSLGLKLNRRTVADLVIGIAIPFVMMGLVYWLEWSLGWLTFEGFAWETENIGKVALNLLGMFLFFVFVGWDEELLFRGYYLQTIASGLNPAWGVFLSSVIFGLAHSSNPSAGWASAAGIFFA
ncbi:MAG: type II CAAX endopeptidase family protein, partial [Chloroflexota bacterium]